MTIKEMADVYVGHSPEPDESVSTTIARKAFIQGAEWMRLKALGILASSDSVPLKLKAEELLNG